MSMGFSYEVSKWALARCNNNINDSISLIHDNGGILEDLTVDNGNRDTSDESLKKVYCFSIYIFLMSANGFLITLADSSRTW